MRQSTETLRRGKIILTAALLGVASLHCGAASDVDAVTISQGVAVAGPIHPRAGANLCLDVRGGSHANGSKVTSWTCHGGANQQWAFDNGNLVVYGNKCLDVESGNTGNGTALRIWDCASNNANQRFVRVGDHFQWEGHSLCIDLAEGSATPGTKVQTWECNPTNTNQSWSAPGPVEAAAGGPTADGLADLCVRTINEYRAGVSSVPVRRATEEEACVAESVRRDIAAGTPHSAFGRCRELGTIACPGYDGTQPDASLSACLSATFGFGPGDSNYEIIMNPRSTRVACAAVTAPDGKLWIDVAFLP